MYKVGDRVMYKAAGKISRLEGKTGQWVPATVVRIEADSLIVLPDHRTVPGVFFYNGQASVPLAQIKKIKNK